MPRKSNIISVLQLDRRLLSLLRVRRSFKGLEVLSFVQERGDWSYEDGTFERALKRFAKAQGVAGDSLYTVLPRHEMTARLLTLPSHDPNEIDGMVRLSAEEYVPYTVEELVVAHCTLQRNGDGSARVLAVFAHRDVVETHVRVLRAAGLTPEQIYLSTTCIASAAITARGSNEERFAVVHLGSEGLEVVALDGSRLEYGRAIATVQDWDLLSSGAQDASDELAGEVRASLLAYRRESGDGRGADSAFVSSDSVDVGPACEALRARLDEGCEPAPFVRSLVNHGAEHLRGIPLAALGAALAAQDRAPVVLSLVPPSLQEARRSAAERRFAVTAFALAFALLAGIAALYGQAVFQRNVYLAELEHRLDSLNPVAQVVEAQERQLAVLRERIDRSTSALELLARACEVLPEQGVNILRYTYFNGEGIRIEGRGESGEVVESLDDRLRELGAEEVPLFAQAELTWHYVTELNQQVVEFAINIPFPQGEEGEEDAGAEAGIYAEQQDWESRIE